MQLKDLKKETKKIIIICADGTLSEAAAFTLIRNKIDAVILKGGMQNVPKNTSYAGEATFTIDDNDQKSHIFFERGETASEDISSTIDQQTNSPDSLNQETELDLQKENTHLKAENTRLSNELDSAKKQYRIRRAILPHEILGTPVAKYSFTYGANWISPSTPCVRFNFAQKPLR